MLLKKLCNAYLTDEEEARHDFFDACDMTIELLNEFEARGMLKGPAMGGAMTQLLSHLIDISPDPRTVSEIIASCLSNAAYNAESAITHEGNDQIH